MNRLSIPRLTGLSLMGPSATMAPAGVPAKSKPARNIIIMIPDGMSVGGATLTRGVNGGGKPSPWMHWLPG